VQELENNLATSNVINLKGLTNEKVVFGCYVSMEDTDSGEKIKYQLVGPYESDINQNKISVTSPIGKAVIGKCVGDEINVKTPGGQRNLEVVKISLDEN
jgi:transcription elongation factor GreA